MELLLSGAVLSALIIGYALGRASIRKDFNRIVAANKTSNKYYWEMVSMFDKLMEIAKWRSGYIEELEQRLNDTQASRG